MQIFRVYYPLRLPVLLLSDVIVISLSFILAAVLLFQEDSYFLLTYGNGLGKIGLLTVLCMAGFHLFDLYDLRQLGAAKETLFRLFVVLGLFSLLLAVVAKLFPAMAMGHGVLFLGTLLLTVGAVSWRLLFARLSQAELLREPVLILGDEKASQDLSQIIRQRNDLCWQPVLFEQVRRQSQNGSGRESVRDVISRLRMRRVIVAFQERRGRMPIQELAWLRAHGIQVEEAPSLLEKLTGRIDLRFTSASWLAFSSGFQVSWMRRLQTRLFSLLLSLLLLLLCLPLIALVSLVIKLESKGPVLIRQRRVGQGGRLFWALKFRSMVQGAEFNAFAPAQENDARVTRVGRFLRRWHLDEVPQLLNIVRGEMNFVGPRPFVPEWEEQLEKEIPFYPLRHVVKPGLTGWAQINRGYCATVEENREKLEFDLFYIKNMSLMLDLWIFFQTTKIVLFGRGVR